MAARLIVVDDTDSKIQYDGSGWFQDQGSQDNAGNFGPAYESTLHGTKTSASLSFSFSGTKVSVYGSNNLRNDSGVLDPTWECFIDNISIGKAPPFQFAENNWLFCNQDKLVDGPHVITVNATVLKAQTFWFDQIQYMPSSSVSLDNTAILVDSSDPALQYGDGWGALGGTANVTQAPNSIFTFSFTGVSLAWYSFIPTEYPHTASLGSYSVDGQSSINFSLKGLPAASTTTIYNQKFFETPQYPAGRHTIVVTYLGNSSTTPLTLDYIVVQNGTFSSSTSSSAPSTPTSGASTDPNRTGSSHSNNTGAIAGGVVGGLVLIGLAILAIIYFRRWDRKQRARPVHGYHGDENNFVEPFHLSPSRPPGPVTYSQYTPVPNRAGNTTQHGSMPSQTTTELNSIIPPSSASGGNPPPTGSSHEFPSQSTGLDNAYLPASVNELYAGNYNQHSPLQTQPPHQQYQQQSMSEKARREAEATAAALRPQRAPQQVVTPPESATSASGSARMIIHEDSGLRLPRPGSDVIEIPPMYTAG